MNDQEQLQAPQNQNTQQFQENSVSVAPTVTSVNTPQATKKPSKLSGLFSGFRHPKVLLGASALLLGVVIVFYAGYQFAVYQSDATGNFLLPHFNFHNQNTLNNNQCPPNVYFVGCGCPSGQNVCSGADEPVIYLYPTHSEKVNVSVLYHAGFSKTVPAYSLQTGWQVLAYPNGTLKNSVDAKTYPYLIWEGNPAPFHFDMSSGFVVSGAETKSFLQHQLAIMGLSQNEISTFIEYWLPKMEQNPYNQIHFAGDEYTRLAPLHIAPKPNSLLRVFMAFKPLLAPVSVSPQSFPTFHRTGFTAVEWGGTELGS